MTDTPFTYGLPSPKPEITAFLKSRRSNMTKAMTGPGPSAEQLSELLEIAARVPDHRKLGPWRFVIFKGQAREDFGKTIASAFMADNPDMPLDRSVFEGARLMRAPTVVAIISSPVKCSRGTPEWEQVLSSGAVCYNLLLAAQSAGFAAQWLTEWFAYDARVNEKLGLEPSEKVAGYIYIGTTETPSTPRARPDVSVRTSVWSSGA
jgi:nitroreductase